jgi:uncharacterized protein YtpQ (UPF0354 family)
MELGEEEEKKKGWDWSFERTKMNLYVESCHGKKGMYLVRHKRQAKDEEKKPSFVQKSGEHT